MLVVKLEDGDTELVFLLGVDFGEAILIRDHLAALGEVDEAAIVSPRGFQRAAPIAIKPSAPADTWRAELGIDFQMIPSGEVELPSGLFLIKPERDVDMHAHRPVFIVARAIFQIRDLTGYAGSDRVHQVAPNLP